MWIDSTKLHLELETLLQWFQKDMRRKEPCLNDSLEKATKERKKIMQLGWLMGDGPDNNIFIDKVFFPNPFVKVPQNYVA